MKNNKYKIIIALKYIYFYYLIVIVLSVIVNILQKDKISFLGSFILEIIMIIISGPGAIPCSWVYIIYFSERSFEPLYLITIGVTSLINILVTLFIVFIYYANDYGKWHFKFLKYLAIAILWFFAGIIGELLSISIYS